MLFRFRYKQLGGHTHLRLFAGTHEGALGLCGSLCMRNEEWEAFQQRLIQLSPTSTKVETLPDHEQSLDP